MKAPHSAVASPATKESESKNPVRRFLRKLGPGLITGAADDDPSGIATYSVAGAQHGTALLWTALVTWPLMGCVQFMCARIGMVTGRGLAGTLRLKFPKTTDRRCDFRPFHREHDQHRRGPLGHGGFRGNAHWIKVALVRPTLRHRDYCRVDLVPLRANCANPQMAGASAGRPTSSQVSSSILIGRKCCGAPLFLPCRKATPCGAPSSQSSAPPSVRIFFTGKVRRKWRRRNPKGAKRSWIGAERAAKKSWIANSMSAAALSPRIPWGDHL